MDTPTVVANLAIGARSVRGGVRGEVQEGVESVGERGGGGEGREGAKMRW
jgi:hypothetical protein